MSIAAVMYSYLLQSISRLFFSVLSTRYRWLISLKTHVILIFIEWLIVFLAPLATLVTKDIYFRPDRLCWVPEICKLHLAYTIGTYYIIPTVLIVTIYIIIYVHIRRAGTNKCIKKSATQRRQNRDLEVLRTIMILCSICILGGVPSGLYILTSIKLFYSIGLVTITFAVTIEKVVLILIDREIRNIVKKFFVVRHP